MYLLYVFICIYRPFIHVFLLYAFIGYYTCIFIICIYRLFFKRIRILRYIIRKFWYPCILPAILILGYLGKSKITFSNSRLIPANLGNGRHPSIRENPVYIDSINSAGLRSRTYSLCTARLFTLLRVIGIATTRLCQC